MAMTTRQRSLREEHPLGASCGRHLGSRRGSRQTQLEPQAWPSYLESLSDTTEMFLMSAEKRQAEAARIREKYPDRIPVIVLSRAGALLPAGGAWHLQPSEGVRLCR